MDYISSCRSNYVHVKTECKDKFDELTSALGFNIKEDELGTYLLKEDGGVESVYYDSDKGEDAEIDWKDIGKMLEPGEVLHIVESGHEGMRYLGGSALFIFSTGKTDYIDINRPTNKVIKFMAKFDKIPTKPHLA